MIVYLASLVCASLLFGGHVDGRTSGMQKRATEAPPQANFTANFDQGNPSVSLNNPSTLHYTISTEQTIPSLSIFLCQTSATSDEINSTNAYQIATLFQNLCVNSIDPTDTSTCATNDLSPLDPHKEIASTFDLLPGPTFDANPSTLSNFFLCFAQTTTPPVCDAYSPVFDLLDPAQSQTSSAPVATRVFANLMSIISTNSILAVTSATVSNEASSITSSPSATSTSIVYVSTPTGTTYIATMTLPPTSPTAAAAGLSTSSRSGGGLSTGALTGVIVGAVGGAFILALLGLLCLRRRKHKRAGRSDTMDSNQPDQVLLTQPYPFIGTRDILAEKYSPTTLTSMLEAPLSRPSILKNPRHSYDSLNASAPYSGLAAAAPKLRDHSPQNSYAQNKSHQQSLLSHSIPSPSISRGLFIASVPLSRGVSDASQPMTPRTVSTIRGEGEDFEEYHDVPIYGDTRHTPTLYESSPSLLHVEEGMSAEDIARLEAEEARIDAAIAAAEQENALR